MKIYYVGYNYIHRELFSIERNKGNQSNIIIATKKPSILYINSQEMNVPENSIIIIKKNTPYKHIAHEKYYCDDWIHFDLTASEEKKHNIPYNSIIATDDISLISFFIEKIYNETYFPTQNSKQKINLYFKLICLELIEKSSYNNNKSDFYNPIAIIRSYIYAHPERRDLCSHYAYITGLSTSRLQHAYKETFGVSIIEDAIHARIEKGKFLLKNSNYKIYEISDILGYKNSNSFMKQFKEITGMTTQQYKKGK